MAQTMAAEPEERMPVKYEIYDYVSSIVFALAVVLLFFTFVFRVVMVTNISMQNTLHAGDRLILSHIGYVPKQGDIVVLSTKAVKGDIIKRVVATGGQTVNINFDTHTVYVDGKALREPYIRQPTATRGDVAFPVTVPPGHVFVMGDNRNYSYDSRYQAIGMIDDRSIVGHAIFRIFPLSKAGALPR